MNLGLLLINTNPYANFDFCIGFNSCFVVIPFIIVFCFALGYFPVTKKQSEWMRIAINTTKLVVPVATGIFSARLFREECWRGLLQWFDNGAATASESIYSGVFAIFALVFIEALLIAAPMGATIGGVVYRRGVVIREKKKNLGRK